MPASSLPKFIQEIKKPSETLTIRQYINDWTHLPVELYLYSQEEDTSLLEELRDISFSIMSNDIYVIPVKRLGKIIFAMITNQYPTSWKGDNKPFIDYDDLSYMIVSL